MKTIKIITYSITLILLSAFGLQAQNAAKRHHLVTNVDLGSGNLYTDAVASTLGGLLNSAMHTNVFGSYYLWSPMTIEANHKELDIEHFKFNGLTAENLFRDVQCGIELGYQTYSPSSYINFGITGVAQYRQNQFKLLDMNDVGYLKHNIQRVLMGGNLFFIVGKMANSSHGNNFWRTKFEVGARYSYAFKYNDPYKLGNDFIKNGLVSHFAIVFTGKTIFEDIGLFADFNHFSLFDDSFDTSASTPVIPNGMKMKMWTIGLCWKVNFQQSGERL